MRIALIDPSLFTLPYDRALARGLAAHNQEVALYGRRIAAADGCTAEEILIPLFYKIAGSRLASVLPRAIRLPLKGLDHIISMRRLLNSLRRERPDVIHFQWLPLPMVDRFVLSEFRRIAPLVLTVHDTNPFNGAPSASVQSAGIVSCFDAFDRLIVHTSQGLARLEALKVPSDKLALLAHGLLEQPPTESTHSEFGEQVVLLMFGKIKFYKGLDVLIEAFAQLPAALQARARIRVVGKSYMNLQPISERARELGVADRLTLEPRHVPDAEIATLFTPNTIVLFPYREIEASGVLFLAIAHGRPVVASALGSFKEVLKDGVHGLLVKPNDPVALAGALTRLLANPGFASLCGQQAQELARKIPRWEDIARETIAVYRAAR